MAIKHKKVTWKREGKCVPQMEKKKKTR